MTHKISLLFLCLTLLVNPLFSQSVFENNRPSTKWYTLETEKYQLVFPETFMGKYGYIANLLDTLHSKGAESISDTSPKKINYIIRNQTAFSNGFVTLAPRRSELYTMPSQNYLFTGTNEWLDQLIIHEFRHVAQYEQVNKGLSRALYYLTGQSVLSGLSYSLIPDWLWEGDAVLTETALTHSGRGRIPGFNRLFMVNAMEKDVFSFNKQTMRSYKDAVPNHYVLGTNLVSYVREKENDPDVWKRVISRTVSKPFVPFMFSHSLKKETGKNIRQYYRKMMTDLIQRETQIHQSIEFTDYQLVFSGDKAYTDYLMPSQDSLGNLYFMKSGLKDIAQIIKTNNSSSQQKRIYTPGIINNTNMSAVDEKYMVWNEYTFHPRWRAESYSNVMVLNKYSGEVRRVSKNKKYNGAAFNASYTMLATTTTSEEYKHSILLLDFETGEEIKSFPNMENAFYSHVKFFNEQYLVAVKLNTQGKSMVLIEIESGVEQQLIHPGKENFGNPVPFGKYIYYTSDFSGIENIYVINTENLERFQVTSVKYGAYNPYPTDSILFFNVQESNGILIGKMNNNPHEWIKLSQVNSEFLNFYEEISEQEGAVLTGDISNDYDIEPKKYNKLKSFFNIHSWGPLANSSLDEAQFGLFSKNVLGTASAYAGYNFNIYDRNLVFEGALSYQGWYPVFDVSFDTGIRKSSFAWTDSYNLDLQWKETNVGFTTRLPFLLTKSKFRTSLDISWGVENTAVSNFYNSLDGDGRLIEYNGNRYLLRSYQDNGFLVSSNYNITFSSILKRAHRQVKPRWGGVVIFDATHDVGGSFEGNSLASRGYFYLPGFFKTHSINGYLAFQERKVDNANVDLYYFRNKVPFPRGGHSISFYQYFLSSALNYELPVWYPDLSVGSMLFLKRLRVNVFTDGATGYQPDVNDVLQQDIFGSAGAEIRIDFNAMRFKPQITIGYRYARTSDQRDFHELIFPVVQF